LISKSIDFLLTQRRNKRAAHLFLLKAITHNGCPEVINIDKSGANKTAIKTYNKRTWPKLKIRQCKDLNNSIEAEHRFIKWRVQSMPECKNFESALSTLTGIEIVRMIKKEQVAVLMATSYSTFCSLAA